MAIVNKAWRQGEFVPTGAEPGLTQPFVWRDIDQEKATQDIAKARFDYPDMKHANLRTYTNRPARQIGVKLDESAKEFVFPDIVIVEEPSNEVSMLAEVETRRSIRETPESELVEKWRAMSFLGDLFLFVPLMDVRTVKAMLKRNKLKIGGVRSWRYITGQNMLDTTDV